LGPKTGSVAPEPKTLKTYSRGSNQPVRPILRPKSGTII